MLTRHLLVLVAQALTFWWCVGGTSPWRLPVPPQPPALPYVKPAAFQMSREYYRARLAAIRNDSRNWPAASAFPTPPLLSVPTKPPSLPVLTGQPPTSTNVSSNPHKNFYRVFYGTPDGTTTKGTASSTSSPTSTSSPYHYRSVQNNGRIIYGMSQDLEDVRQANEHFLRIRVEARCSVPKPKVIRVKDHYPDPTKEYLPRCTILHRCGDDSSCCDNESFECVAKEIQEVELHFYVLQVKFGSLLSSTNTVEKVLFENHTSCWCQGIPDLPRSLDRAPSWATTHVSTTTTTDLPSSTVTTSTAAVTTTRESNHLYPSKCGECPVPFSRREFSDGRCSCDCFDRHKPCLKIKRGRDPLHEVERRCVEAAHCHIPECEYGLYDYDTGRCPKKPDNYKKPPEGKEYHNHHHRWNFFERD